MKKAKVDHKLDGKINPCPRCGSERVSGKTWREKINGSWVTYTETSCPDKECQKKVDKELRDIARKRKLLMKQKAKFGNKRQSITLGRSSKYRFIPGASGGVW